MNIWVANLATVIETKTQSAKVGNPFQTITSFFIDFHYLKPELKTDL